MSRSLSRRKWLKWAGTAAVLGGVSIAAYYGLTSPTMPATSTTIEATTTATEASTASVYSTPTTSLVALTDYLTSNGVSSSVADIASDYGTLDKNKKELGDLVITIGELEPVTYVTEAYQRDLLRVLKEEDANDISNERLGTLRYLFSDRSLLINMLEFCMYPGVFDYLEPVVSRYPDVDKRIVYATLAIPRFRKVSENKSTFETIMQKGTDPRFTPAFDQMLCEGNVDKSKYSARRRSGCSTFCTPIESLVWELLDGRNADHLLTNYDMRTLVNEAFRNTKASGNYRSAEWASWDIAANRLGFNSWISWKWVKDNMMYDRSLAGKPHIYRSPEDIYAEKLNEGIATGDCLHAAEFCLQNIARGAAKASILHIVYDHPSAGRQNHYVTLEYRNKSDIYVVMNFGFDGALPIIGPFRTESDAANATVGALGGGGVVRQISSYATVNWDL